jgi:hypothetical protein
VAYAVAVIRWSDASSDGRDNQTPGWGGNHVGFLPFPTLTSEADHHAVPVSRRAAFPSLGNWHKKPSQR